MTALTEGVARAALESSMGRLGSEVPGDDMVTVSGVMKQDAVAEDRRTQHEVGMRCDLEAARLCKSSQRCSQGHH